MSSRFAELARAFDVQAGIARRGKGAAGAAGDMEGHAVASGMEAAYLDAATMAQRMAEGLEPIPAQGYPGELGSGEPSEHRWHSLDEWRAFGDSLAATLGDGWIVNVSPPAFGAPGKVEATSPDVPLTMQVPIDWCGTVADASEWHRELAESIRAELARFTVAS